MRPVCMECDQCEASGRGVKLEWNQCVWYEPGVWCKVMRGQPLAFSLSGRVCRVSRPATHTCHAQTFVFCFTPSRRSWEKPFLFPSRGGRPWPEARPHSGQPLHSQRSKSALKEAPPPAAARSSASVRQTLRPSSPPEISRDFIMTSSRSVAKFYRY